MKLRRGARRGRLGARGSTGSEAAGLGLGMPSAARRGGRSRPQEASAARSVGAGCGRAGREPCPRARAAQAGQQAPGPCPDPQRSPPPGRRPAIQFRFKVIRPRAHRSSPGRPSGAGGTARRSDAPVVDPHRDGMPALAPVAFLNGRSSHSAPAVPVSYDGHRGSRFKHSHPAGASAVCRSQQPERVWPAAETASSYGIAAIAHQSAGTTPSRPR